jgi:hypothetical protein
MAKRARDAESDHEASDDDDWVCRPCEPAAEASDDDDDWVCRPCGPAAEASDDDDDWVCHPCEEPADAASDKVSDDETSDDEDARANAVCQDEAPDQAVPQKATGGKARLACSKCTKTYANRGGLKRHVDEAHGDGPTHACTECPKKFYRKDQLDDHISSIHLGLRPYPCGQCEYKAPTACALQQHIRQVHDQLKPHACMQCSSKFHLKTQLERHKWSVHLGLRPFACKECDVACTQQVHLDAHVAIWHSEDAVVRRKQQELRVHRALIGDGFIYTTNKGDATPLSMHFVREHHVTFKCVGGTHARIDFVLTLANGSIVLLEVDEKQHRFGYDIGCDMRRMGRIVESLRVGGFVGAIRFLRYNCDAYKVAGKNVYMPKRDRETALLAVLHAWSEAPPLENGVVRISYCYYDRTNTTATQPVIVSDPEYHPVYAAVAESLM